MLPLPTMDLVPRPTNKFTYFSDLFEDLRDGRRARALRASGLLSLALNRFVASVVVPRASSDRFCNAVITGVGSTQAAPV